MKWWSLLILLMGCAGDEPEVTDTEEEGEEESTCVLPIESEEEPRLELMVLEWSAAIGLLGEGILVFDDELSWTNFLSENALESPFLGEGVEVDFVHQQVAISVVMMYLTGHLILQMVVYHLGIFVMDGMIV